MDTDNFKNLIETILEYLNKLPNPPREKLKKQWQDIKEFVMDAREPKILIIGRRGAGKSSLINAIFEKKVTRVGSVMSETGEPTWHKYENERGTLKILDTRGLGDRSKPESANFENAFDEITYKLKSECPDIALFLCKAKEVDSHITEDVKNVTKIYEFIKKQHKYDLPVVSIVTQVDELDPKRVEPPYENKPKQENISRAVKAIEEAFYGSGIDLLKAFPVSAYAEYDDVGNITFNNFWNIDKTIEYLIEKLPKEAKLTMAKISRITSIQKKTARGVITTTASACAGIAATPIPIGDIFPITGLQISMIIGVGYIGGRKLDKKTAVEFMTAAGMNVGVGFALREASRFLIKTFFPGVGNAVSAAIAFAGTWAIGETAIAYFIENKSIEEAKKQGREAYNIHEKELPIDTQTTPA